MTSSNSRSDATAVSRLDAVAIALREHPVTNSQALERRIAELEAALLVERAHNERQRALERLATETRALRNEMLQKKQVLPQAGHTHGPLREEVVLNDSFDTDWAHADDRFRKTLHVFHQGWHGIRAAAGFLPGSKLLIPATREMSPEELRRALAWCAPFEAVVFHGFSSHAEVLLKLLRKHGTSQRTYAVWHGSTAQFHSEVEQNTFAKLVSLKRRKLLNGFGSVKPDMHYLSEHIHPKALVNVAPRMSPRIALSAPPTGRVLIPVRNNFWKNFYTNVYAASGHRLVREVLVTSHYGHQTDFNVGTNVVEVKEPARRELLALTARCDLVLNVTLTDCQPMTAVEALAVGVPCLTGELALPELSEHPYQDLVTVHGSDLIGQIRAGIERVLTMRHNDSKQLTGLLNDYQGVLLRVGLTRLAEFIGV